MVLIPCNHHEVSLPAASATYLSEALYALATRGFAIQCGLTCLSPVSSGVFCFVFEKGARRPAVIGSHLYLGRRPACFALTPVPHRHLLP